MRIFPQKSEDILLYIYNMWNHQPSTMWKLGKGIISWSSCLSYPLYEELCSMYTVRWSLVRVLITFQPTRTLLHLFNHCLRPANVAEEEVQHICQRRLPLQPSHWRGNKPSLLQTPDKKRTCLGLLVTGLYSSGEEKTPLNFKELQKKIKCHHEKTGLLYVGTAPDAINLIHMQHRT